MFNQKYHARRQAGFIHVFLVVLLLAGIAVGVYLVQHKQIFKGRAFDFNPKQGVIPPPNRPPVTPLIAGPTEAFALSAVNFSFNSFDFDGQKAVNVFYIGSTRNDSDTVLINKLNVLKQANVDVIQVDIPWSELQPDSASEWKADFFVKRLKLIANQGFLLQVQVQPALMEPAWFKTSYPDIDFVSEEGKKVRDYYTSDMGDSVPHVEYPSYWNPQTKVLINGLFKKTAESILNDPVLHPKILLTWVSVGHWGEPFYPLIINYGTASPKVFMTHFFAYDLNAQNKFRTDMQNKYKTLYAANNAWDTNFSGWTLIIPPRPGQYTNKYWDEFLNWYRDEKVSYVSWAVDAFKQYTDRPFYATGIAKFYPQQDWDNIVNNKGVSTDQEYGSIKRMYDNSALISKFADNHLWMAVADLPDRFQLEKTVQQSWGQNVAVPIIGESAGDKTHAGKTQEIADEFIEYGLDVFKYVPDPTGTGFPIFNADGSPTANFAKVAEMFKRIKDYRNPAKYMDQVKYVIDWGDGTSTTSEFSTPGVNTQIQHKWTSPGTYQISAKAIDKAGAKSFVSNPLKIEITPAVANSQSPLPTPSGLVCDSYPDGRKCPPGNTCNFANEMPSGSGQCIPVSSPVPFPSTYIPHALDCAVLPPLCHYEGGSLYTCGQLVCSDSTPLPAPISNKPTCNQVALHIFPSTVAGNQKINFSITDDASTYIGDDFGGGASNCSGDWTVNGSGLNCTTSSKGGDYTWIHTWKHCVGSFNNCSDTCTATAVFSIIP